MTRKKVKLMWIVNDSARKASLRKRRVGLLKKVSELTTLCDVNAFILIYSPEEREPQMWPSRPVVEQLVSRFNNMSEMEKNKKMMNQETYLKERVGKVQDQLKKHHRKNKEMDVSQVMEKLHEHKTIDDFSINELLGLIWFSEEKKKEIRKRIEYYQQVNPLPPESLPPPPLPPPPPPPQLPAPVESTAGAKGEEGNPPESDLWDQWFIDMMNNSENISGSSGAKAKSDAGLTSHQALASAIGMSHENPGAHTIDYAMGTPQQNINININIGSSSLPGGSNSGNDGNIGQPQGNAGEASNAASSMGLPSELFGGSIAGSDFGMPYDVTKQWPGNFYP